MTEKTTDIEELEETEEVEEEAEEQKISTPGELADLLEVDPKAVRAFLRANFARPKEMKGKSWSLTDKQVEAVVAHFSPAEDEEEETEESD